MLPSRRIYRQISDLSRRSQDQLRQLLGVVAASIHRAGFLTFVLTESMTLQVHTVLDYVSSAAGVAALD